MNGLHHRLNKGFIGRVNLDQLEPSDRCPGFDALEQTGQGIHRHRFWPRSQGQRQPLARLDERCHRVPHRRIGAWNGLEVNRQLFGSDRVRELGHMLDILLQKTGRQGNDTGVAGIARPRLQGFDRGGGIRRPNGQRPLGRRQVDQVVDQRWLLRFKKCASDEPAHHAARHGAHLGGVQELVNDPLDGLAVRGMGVVRQLVAYVLETRPHRGAHPHKRPCLTGAGDHDPLFAEARRGKVLPR